MNELREIMDKLDSLLKDVAYIRKVVDGIDVREASKEAAEKIIRSKAATTL